MLPLTSDPAVPACSRRGLGDARRGIWENLFRELARNGRSTDTQMIDSTHVKAHRSASGGKAGSRSRQLAARAEGATRRSTHSQMLLYRQNWTAREVVVSRIIEAIRSGSQGLKVWCGEFILSGPADGCLTNRSARISNPSGIVKMKISVTSAPLAAGESSYRTNNFPSLLNANIWSGVFLRAFATCATLNPSPAWPLLNFFGKTTCSIGLVNKNTCPLNTQNPCNGVFLTRVCHC
jgi:hypothetical protein